jgi:hypothetical protein
MARAIAPPVRLHPTRAACIASWRPAGTSQSRGLSQRLLRSTSTQHSKICRGRQGVTREARSRRNVRGRASRRFGSSARPDCCSPVICPGTAWLEILAWLGRNSGKGTFLIGVCTVAGILLNSSRFSFSQKREGACRPDGSPPKAGMSRVGQAGSATTPSFSDVAVFTRAVSSGSRESGPGL